MPGASGSGWVHARLQSHQRNSHCGIRPALYNKLYVRSSAQTPPWGGEYPVGRSEAAGQDGEERKLRLLRRLPRIAARSPRTPSTAIDLPFGAVVRVLLDHVMDLLGELANNTRKKDYGERPRGQARPSRHIYWDGCPRRTSPCSWFLSPFSALRRHRCSPVGLYLGGGLPGHAVNRIINSCGNSRNRILAFKFSRSRGPRRKRLAVGAETGCVPLCSHLI